jgi:hypothetical protein
MPVIPAPGSVGGPCAADCDHNECDTLRKLANVRCSNCNERIGFDNEYLTYYGPLAHKHCATLQSEES